MDAYDENDDENLKPNTTYYIPAKTKWGKRGREDSDVAYRLQLTVITDFDIRTAPDRMARNVLVGELLENPVELILSEIPGLIYYRNKRWQPGKSPQAIPDFDIGYQGRTVCIECKNWLCDFTLDQMNIDRLIVPRFEKFQSAKGLTSTEFVKVAILAGIRLTAEVEYYLKYHRIIVVSLPAIHPPRPEAYQWEFLEDSLWEILNGSDWPLYQLTE